MQGFGWGVVVLFVASHRATALQNRFLQTTLKRGGVSSKTAVTCSVQPVHRRELLMGSVGSVVGLSSMSVQDASNHPLRVCVVGAGSISREFALYHFGRATGTVVTSIVDIDEERARSLAADVSSVQAGAPIDNGSGNRYLAQVKEARGSPLPYATRLEPPCLDDCDLVYIGTPPGSHAQLVQQALAAHKSVLLEKPLAARPADADAIVKAAERAQEEHGVLLGLDIGMRWNPALTLLRQLAVLDEGLGSLSRCKLTLAFERWPRSWQVQPWVARRAQGGPLREVRVLPPQSRFLCYATASPVCNRPKAVAHVSMHARVLAGWHTFFLRPDGAFRRGVRWACARNSGVCGRGGGRRCRDCGHRRPGAWLWRRQARWTLDRPRGMRVCTRMCMRVCVRARRRIILWYKSEMSGTHNQRPCVQMPACRCGRTRQAATCTSWRYRESAGAWR